MPDWGWFLLKFLFVALVILFLLGWVVPWLGVSVKLAVVALVLALLVLALWFWRKCCKR